MMKILNKTLGFSVFIFLGILLNDFQNQILYSNQAKSNAQSVNKYDTEFQLELSAEDYFVKGLNNKFDIETPGADILSEQKLAISNFTKAINLNTTYIQAYLERGKVYSNLDNTGAAIDDLNKVIELNPNYAEAYFERAKVYNLQGNKQKAIEDYSQAIKIYPSYAEAYYQRGLIYDELGKPETAIENYIQVIQIDTNHLAYREDNEKAVSNYQQLLQKDVNFTNIYYRELASFYIKGDQWDSLENRIQAFSNAINLKSDFAETYYFRGRNIISYSVNLVYLEIYLDISERQKAVDSFSKAIELNPNYAEAYYWRALLQPSHEQAIQDLTQAIIINSKYADAYYQRGLFYSQLENDADAISDLITALTLSPGVDSTETEKVIEILRNNPQDGNDYYQRGLIRFKLEDLTGAISDFTSAIQYDPNLKEAYYYRGLANRYLGVARHLGTNVDSPDFFQKVIEPDFQKVIELDPNFTNAYLERAIPLGQAEDQDISGNLYKVISINPHIAEAYFALAYYYHDEKYNYDKKNILQAIRTNPNFSYSYCLAGFGCEPRWEEIKSTFSPEFNPNFYSSRVLIDRSISRVIQLNLENTKQQVSQSTQSIKDNPQNAEGYYVRGTSLLKLTDLESAIQDLTQAIKLEPENADVFYSRGTAFYKQKNYQQALEDLNQAIKLNPDLPDIYLMRALTYYDLENNQKAYKDANQAIRLDPLFAEAYYIRGLALENLGYLGAAEADYDRASHSLWPCISQCGGGSSLQSSNPNVYYERGRLLARQGNRQEAIATLEQAASLFQVQGNNDGYQKTQSLMKRLQN